MLDWKFADLMDALVEAAKGGRPIMIHCNAGTHRSPAVGAAIAVWSGTMSAEAAKTAFRMLPDFNKFTAAVVRLRQMSQVNQVNNLFIFMKGPL